MRLRLPFLVLSITSFAVAAGAMTILSPVSATASSEFSSEFDIGNTIDQSGLSSLFVSGLTDFDAYLTGDPHHDSAAGNKEWFTAVEVTSAVVEYDLGASYRVDRLLLWNEESSGMGVFDLLVSLDGVSFVPIASNLMGTDHPANNSPYPADTFSFSPFNARFVRFEIGSCPQPNGPIPPAEFCAIGEVAFSISPATNVPEPGSLMIFAAGLGLVFRGRSVNPKAERHHRQARALRHESQEG